MRFNISVLAVLLILGNAALGAVGDGGVTDNIFATAPLQDYPVQGSNSVAGAVPGNSPEPQMAGAFNYPGSGYSQAQNYPGSAAGVQGSGYIAPQAAGPYQERLSADDLKLGPPQAESFQPDGGMDFAPATPPGGLAVESYSSLQSGGSWYYPELSSSSNHLYVQTKAGLKTIAGCSYRGYLPLWADISAAGNFYVYEWYPGQNTPSVSWGGWTWPGWKRGWFSGDAAGWHILCYNCRDWSNYVYIYVHSAGSGAYPSAAVMAPSSPVPSGAPTPPDPNAENLILPDYKLFSPSSGGYQAQGSYYSQQAFSGPATNYGSSGCQSCNLQSSSPAGTYKAGYGTSPAGCTDCSAQGAYKSNYPASGSCPSCTGQGSISSPGQVMQTYKAVFPSPSTCRCNEYYLQTWQNKLTTVGSARCNEWMPLWSKISRPGCYWSYEWTMCGTGNYCPPDVKNFGNKGTGWYQTWFRDYRPGWHVLSYYSNDWSNYIYIYVWPAS